MNIKTLIKEYVKLPSISADPSFKEGVRASANFMADLLKKIGVVSEIVETEGNPIVLGRYRVSGDNVPHIIVYGHYDVQPVDPIDLWKSEPFDVVERDGWLFGRGVADNKGPHLVSVVAFAKALKTNPDLKLNVTFVFEGEEEIGSAHFSSFLKQYKDELSTADFVLLSDTASPKKDLISITTGLRGVVGLNVRFDGPSADLHSGVYGGAIYNPLQAMMEVCASLHNADGTINIPGFYDGVAKPFDWERKELSRLGLNDEDMKALTGVDTLHTEPGYNSAEAIRFLPTLEFNGIGGGYQGEGSKTIVPATVFAKITCRIIPGMKATDVYEKVANAIKTRTPKGIKSTVTSMQQCEAYFVCPPNCPNTPENQNKVLEKAFLAADDFIEKEFGQKPIYVREGGSIGIIESLKKIIGVDALMIGLFLPESMIHSPNEKIEISMLERGILVYEGIYNNISKK